MKNRRREKVYDKYNKEKKTITQMIIHLSLDRKEMRDHLRKLLKREIYI